MRSASTCIAGTSRVREHRAALRKLFGTMPRDVDAGEVSAKVAALNRLYPASIYGVVQMPRPSSA